MKIKLGEIIDATIDFEKVDRINTWEKNLNKILVDRNYGNDVQKIFVILAITALPDYWVKPTRPKYILEKEKYVKEFDRTFRTFKQLEVCVVMRHEEFEAVLHASESDVPKIVWRKIIDTFKAIKKYPGKVKDFDSERFIQDLEEFYATQIKNS